MSGSGARLGLVVMAVVVGLLPASARAASWSIEPASGSLQQAPGFDAVSCAGASACTAVGDYDETASGNAQVTLAERWNGSGWRIQHTPNPSGGSGALEAVSCPSRTSCFAVGSWGTGGSSYTLAERWDGSSWKIQRTPNEGHSDSSELLSVSCTSPDACVAVGDYVTETSGMGMLAMHWNGTSWKLVPPINPSGRVNPQLDAVSCDGSDCTAVGNAADSKTYQETTLAERWNGAKWQVQATPNPAGPANPRLSSVSCPAVRACTAVGEDEGTTGYFALVEHWDGSSWKIQSSPDPGTAAGSEKALNQLFSVSCSAANTCTAVGGYQLHSGVEVTLAERRDGSGWTVQSTPDPPESTISVLYGVSCSSANGCQAAGDGNTSTDAFAEGYAERPTGVARPTITGISPRKGVPPGGTVVTITGTNLSGATAVHFGTAKGKIDKIISDTKIVVTSPKGPGLGVAVNVTVTTAGGTSATNHRDRYLYTYC